MGLREQSICGAGVVGFRKKFINNFVFPIWACAAGFNNNDDNNNNNNNNNRAWVVHLVYHTIVQLCVCMYVLSYFVCNWFLLISWYNDNNIHFIIFTENSISECILTLQ